MRARSHGVVVHHEDSIGDGGRSSPLVGIDAPEHRPAARVEAGDRQPTVVDRGDDGTDAEERPGWDAPPGCGQLQPPALAAIADIERHQFRRADHRALPTDALLDQIRQLIRCGQQETLCVTVGARRPSIGTALEVVGEHGWHRPCRTHIVRTHDRRRASRRRARRCRGRHERPSRTGRSRWDRHRHVPSHAVVASAGGDDDGDQERQQH